MLLIFAVHDEYSACLDAQAGGSLSRLW